MIPVQQARGIYTEQAIAVYQENAPQPSFLKNLFRDVTSQSKYVSVEVRRDTEFIAVDVQRGGGGNMNTFSRSTLREYLPPFYAEEFDATALDRYDVAFGQNPMLTPETIGYLSRDTGLKLAKLEAKIMRAKEKQCAQVLETGVITLVNGDSIDFKRKAGSLVDPGTGQYWANDIDIEAQIVDAGTFIRNEGKNAVKELDLIISSSAWIKLKASTYFKNVANFNQVKLINITRPIANAYGAVYHGQIDAGGYTVNIWTYDEVYQANPGGTLTTYLDPKKAIFLPVAGAELIMAHAGVPAIIRDVTNAEFPEWIRNIEATSWVNNYIDPRGKAHIFELLSAPVAVPVSVDQIYTLKVIE